MGEMWVRGGKCQGSLMARALWRRERAWEAKLEASWDLVTLGDSKLHQVATRLHLVYLLTRVYS